MKKIKKSLLIGVCAIGIISLLCGPVMAALKVQTVTITGTVNENNQLVDENEEFYEIGDNEKGAELGELVGRKVKVTGTVEEVDGSKTVMVSSYQLVDEKESMQ